MSRIGAGLVAFLLMFLPARAVGPKVASINMCTDQLVLALADDDQILGLSPYATDVAHSWYIARARQFPLLSGLAEDVLPLRPDVVLTATFVKPETRALLKRAGHRVEEFEAAVSLAEVTAQIERAALLLGHPERAAAIIARIMTARDAARNAARDRPLRVLPLERRGWVTGGNSLVTEILATVGLLNLGGSAAGEIGGLLALETIIAVRPDRLLLSSPGESAEDQGTALLRHPALARIVPREHRLLLPQNMTVCGGPMLADAFEHLTREIRR